MVHCQTRLVVANRSRNAFHALLPLIPFRWRAKILDSRIDLLRRRNDLIHFDFKVLLVINNTFICLFLYQLQRRLFLGRQRETSEESTFNDATNESTLVEIEFFRERNIYTFRYVTIHCHHASHVPRRICNKKYDASWFFPISVKIRGKEYEFSERRGAKSWKKRRKGEKVFLSLFLRVEERLVETRARKGWTRFGFSTNFPAALRITRFTSEREQRGCWRVSWLGGSRVIINTGSREEKCQQGKKTFFCGRGSKCTSLRTSVQSRRRGGGGGGGKSKLGRRRVRGNSVVRTSRKPYPFRREITIEKRGSVLLLVRLTFFNRLSGRATFAQTLERILNSPEWKIQRISLERDSLLLSSSFERISSHDFISEREREKFEFERHKRLERESSRIDRYLLRRFFTIIYVYLVDSISIILFQSRPF